MEYQKEKFRSEDDTNIIILDEFTMMRHEILLATLQINNKKFLQDKHLIENTKDLFKSIIENIDERKNKNKNCIVIDYPKDGTDFELYLNQQPVYFIEDLRKEFYHSCKDPIKVISRLFWFWFFYFLNYFRNKILTVQYFKCYFIKKKQREIGPVIYAFR